MIKVNQLALPGTLEIIPQIHADDRGYFYETFNAAELSQHGVTHPFVQDNQSLSRAKGTLRGLHYQTPPMEQAKLVRVLSGALYDVAVDIRAGSPTFGRWVGVELSAERFNQLYIPAGFAHGFVTLTEDTLCHYKVSAPYDRACDRTIRYDDPAIGIDWPLNNQAPTLSEKDKTAPLLNEQHSGFIFGEF